MWEIYPLSSLCDILDSRRKPITKKDRSPGPYPYYGATGILDYVEGYLFDEKLVLIGEDGAKWGAGDNSAFIINGKTWVNNHAHVIRPKRDKVLDKWLIYYLNGKDLSDFITGMTVPKLNQGKLKEIPIPLPPIPEQQRIVAILDQAFADIEKARANAEKNLNNARELFNSYLNQVFSQRGEGWVDEKMSEVCEGKITDGTHQTPKYFNSGYIFLSSKNVTSGKIDWDNVKYLDELQHIEMQKRLSPRKNDILLAKNGTTGVAAIVDKDVVFDIYVSLALLRPSNKILPRYLLHFVNSPLAKYQFNKRLKGIGVPNLHLKEIRDVTVSLPVSIEEQSQIISQVDMLLAKRSRLEEIYLNKLASLEELKKSLLQKAFAGELTKTEGMVA